MNPSTPSQLTCVVRSTLCRINTSYRVSHRIIQLKESSRITGDSNTACKQCCTSQTFPTFPTGAQNQCAVKLAPRNELFFYNCPVNTSISKAFYKVILFALRNRNHNVCVLGPDWFVFFFSLIIVNLWLDKVLAEGSRCQSCILHRVWSHYCPLVPCNLPHD